MTKNNTSTTDIILVTNEWRTNISYMVDPNLFNEFMMVYKNIMGESETNLDLEKLNDRLTRFGLDKNIRVGKLFNQLYYVNIKTSQNSQIVIINGFFDATEFLNKKCINSNDEIQFFWKVILQFINCGGIVRINGVDFLPGDVDVMLATIKNGFGI